jgi:YjbE family integral membrane protein
MEILLGSSLAILQIIWIDLLLSGDNAVVIALACRSLPPHQRKIGMLLGAGAAVGLRIIFAFIITQLLAVPFLKVVGGVLLFWIAVKLARGEDEGVHEIDAADSLWRAVRTIAIADAAMSLDNVIAIAAVARGEAWLFIFGLALSIPLIIAGSALVMGIITRFPIFVWAGAALLGWIAGEMIISDPWIVSQVGHDAHMLEWAAATICAVGVAGIAFILKRRAEAPNPAP